MNLHKGTGFFALAIAIFLARALSAQQFVIGEVTAIKGQPEFSHEKFGRRLVIAGSAVYGNDLIKTAENSNVVVGFFDRTFLKVGPNSQLRLTKYVYTPTREIVGVQIDLLLGQMRLWAETKLRGEVFQIRSNNAVAGVRGTEFEFGYRPQEESTLVAVLEGKVFFYNRQLGRDEGQEVPKGYWGEVKGSKPPGKPQPLDKPPANFEFINR